MATFLFTAALFIRCLQPRAPAFFAGFLGSGAAFGLAVSFVLLPVSLIGIFFLGLGLLGLLPFLTTHAYFVEARLDWKEARRLSGRVSPRGVALIGCVIPIVVIGATHALVEQRFQNAVTEVMAEDPARQAQGTEVLNSLRFVVDVGRLVDVYAAESEVDRKKRLAKAYDKIVGMSIEAPLMD